MIDFHTHILPKMDDGSRSTDEGVKMLLALKEQGIDAVAATPHFYANDESVQAFLKRRQASFEALKSAAPDGMPEIILGAEVKYYEGISRLDGLESLCLQGTRLLLLEMPMRSWTEYNVRELIDISCSGKIIPVLAHIERYMRFQKNGVFDMLLENDVLMQINASFVCGMLTKSKAIALLGRRMVHFIGSDCHNMSDRPPNIGKAYEIIRKKLGEDFSEGFNEYAKNYIYRKDEKQ